MKQHFITRCLTSHTCLAFFYGVFLFLYELSFIGTVVTVIHPLLIGWAGALTVYDVLIRRIWQKVPYWQWIVLFMVVAGVTAVLNIETGVVTSAKGWIMAVLPLLVFYPTCLLSEQSDRKKTLITAMLGAAIVVFIASAVSLWMYLARISQTITLFDVKALIGYRYYVPGDPNSGMLLYGIYKDTNHAAAFALIVAAYSVVLFRACMKGLFDRKWKNMAGGVFAVINFLVQICYFPLANSRGGWLCLLATFGIVAFLYFCFSCAAIKQTKRLLTVTISLVLTVVCVVSVYGGLLGIRTGISSISIQMHQPPSGDTTQLPDTSDPLEGTDQTGDTFDKQDSYSGSGRLLIWKETLQLFSRKPIFGTAPGNNQYFAQKYGIALQKIGAGAAVHNSYLDLLVDYGVVGTIVLLVFLVLCLCFVVKTISKHGKSLGMSFYFTAFMVLFIGGVAFFLSCVYINTTAMYFSLLIPVGYLLAECRDNRSKE